MTDSLMQHLIEHLHMWYCFAVIAVAIVLYVTEKFSLELTSMLVICALLLFFHLNPLTNANGDVTLLDMRDLLAGFANPALLAVLALLVIGQAVVRTGALNSVARGILTISGGNGHIAIVLAMIVVMLVSAILNNTPVVVIFIPIMAEIARQMGKSVSSVMMPLSFAAILGGMTTLIGSSTNLLVAGEMEVLGMQPIGFFDFLVPGSVLAATGLVYVLLIAPRILPDRAGMVGDLMGKEKPQFIAQLTVPPDSPLVGLKLESNDIELLPDSTIKMVQREEHAFLPPFDVDDVVLRAGDTLVVSTTRQAITELLAQNPGILLHKFPEMKEGQKESSGPAEGLSLAEIVVAPASRMAGMTLEQIGFRYHYHCIVLGLQRGTRMIRARMTEIRLAAGDVLLVMGQQEDILSFKDNKDVLLMEWSTEELPSRTYARLSALVLFSVLGVAAFNLVPITIAAMIGAAVIVLSGCLTIPQALRTVDSKIVFLIAAALAMSASLQATGGAAFIAGTMTSLLSGFGPMAVLSAMFIVMALATNVLSNNAAALLFTPIAVNAAFMLDVDPYMFAYAVIFACNCSFATPIGYQTNLLVMGPGHYRFADFLKAGVPLMILMWLTYTTFAYFYYLS
jgi:di/tricarboxylate transporter